MFSRRSDHFWPTANTKQGFEWSLMTAPETLGGPVRLTAQFLRANIDPSVRYILSVPKSVLKRLAADDTDFSNLTIIGRSTYPD
jgi:hypothetical protein